MEFSRANYGRKFDLLAQPLRILGVEPAATSQQINDAFHLAEQNRVAPAGAVMFARDALLDPARRLSYELTYPLDCPASEVETFYHALSTTATTDELLQFADQLWPLARANFVAHVASHRPANGSLLYALVESHASIDASEIYAKLKAARTIAQIPAPSWMSLNQCLTDLLDIHAAAAFEGYDTLQDAAEPVLECTTQILAHGERHYTEVLGVLLASYRQIIDPLRTDAAKQIESACGALRQQPSDASLIQELSNAVLNWTSLCRPLLVWNANQGCGEPDFETPIERLRGLFAHLFEDKQYQVAIEVTKITRDVFSAVPTTLDQLSEDARFIADLSLYANVKHLQDVIDEVESEPGPLIAALEKGEFGQTSAEPAKSLWKAFVQAATAARSTPSTDEPWRMARDFAIRLSNKPEAAAAVVAVLAGLILYGEKVSAPPALLDALRGNLSFMRSFMGDEPSTAGSDTHQPDAGKRSRISKLFARMIRGNRQNSLTDPGTRRRKLLVGFVLFASVLGGLAFYFDLDQLRAFWSKLTTGVISQAAFTLDAQTIPPVGTGQHLELDEVRYCHFQQERLRFIKQQVQRPEDARAYNLMIVDYNSRCSDFFYKDEDLKLVLTEVSAKKDLLEAEAKRIVSSWHHADLPPKN